MNVLFKKMQKDDKKEVLEFHILGGGEKYQNDLIGMAGGIVVLHLEGTQLNAEFKSIQRDSKKISLKFDVKGDNEAVTIKLYPKAGHNVNLTLEESQMSLEDFDMNRHEGVEVKANKDGSIEVVEGQIGMGEIVVEGIVVEDDLPFEVKVEELVEEVENEDDLPL